jgi:hypothetical protein
MSRESKILNIPVTILLWLLFLSVPGAFSREIQNGLSDDQTKTLKSIKQIDDYPLYTMTYYGDYGFDEFLKKGHTDIAAAKALIFEGCSCFTALNRDGDKIYGRNHDWEPCSSVIFFTDSPTGYPSISMTVGWYIDAYLAYPSDENAQMLLSLPYLTLDGINEYGVVISGQNVAGEWVHNPNKISLTALEIRRLVLDYARDLKEAVALIRQYNNLSCEGNKLLLSDAYGNSAIIEYFNGMVNVIRNQEPWQVSTNFLAKYELPDSVLDRCWRYRNVYLALQSYNGLITNPIAMDILSSVYNYTQRSAVYNQTTGKVILCVGGKYGQIHKLRLPMTVDLEVIKSKVSDTYVRVGGNVSLATRIANRSPRPSKATKVKFYLSKKRKLNTRAILIGTRKLQSLAYKKKKTLRLSIDLPEQITAGKYFLIICVDENRRNNDPNPENNIFISTEKITLN